MLHHGEVSSWLDLSTSHAEGTEDQRLFVGQVRELLDAAGTPGLDRTNADATVWSEPFDGALLIVLPLISSPHASIQLQMTATAILGNWTDKHYVWDCSDEGAEFAVDGTDAPARAQVLAWLDHEMHRPFVQRRDSWGPFRRTTWTHVDEPAWVDQEGFLPPFTTSARSTEEPAGYLDPAPPGSADWH